MTFEDLARREPRLAELQKRCINLPDGVCATTFWGDAKSELKQLVGWHVDDPVLGTEAAYNVAWRETYVRLPDCIGRCPSCGGKVAAENSFTGVHPAADTQAPVTWSGVYDRANGVRKSWVLSVDMLGYSDSIRDAAAAGRAAEHLRDLFRIISSAYRYLNPATKRWALKIYSDNALVGYPVSDDGEGEVGRLFDSVAQFQLSVVLQGQFVRGGLAAGYAFVDEDIAYGLPLLEAHHVEAQIARSPRIVLTSAARRILARHADYFDDPYRRTQNYPVLVDADGKWFIDYLSRISGDRPYWGLDEGAMLLHRERVQRALETYDKVERIGPKYRWAVAYHNAVCRGIERLDLAVPYGGELPAAPHRPTPDDVDAALAEQRARQGVDPWMDLARVFDIAIRRTGTADDESGAQRGG